MQNETEHNLDPEQYWHMLQGDENLAVLTLPYLKHLALTKKFGPDVVEQYDETHLEGVAGEEMAEVLVLNASDFAKKLLASFNRDGIKGAREYFQQQGLDFSADEMRQAIEEAKK